MDEDKMKDLMIDYIDGNLTGELNEFVVKHLEKDEESRRYFEELKLTMNLLKADREVEPDENLRIFFDQALEEEIARDHKQRSMSPASQITNFSLWKIAATVALLISGVFLGMWIMKDNTKDQQIADLKKEMEATKRMVALALEDKKSASTRLQGIYVAFNSDKADDELLNTLVRTMNNDDNTNVRLAAVDALLKFSDDPKIMGALLNSMESQSDPIVQIKLINIMVELKQKGAVFNLKKIIKKDATIESVKDEAHMAIFKLS